MPDFKDAQTQLHYAVAFSPLGRAKAWVEQRRVAVSQRLLAGAAAAGGGGAAQLANMADRHGTTALHVAALHNLVAVAELLLQSGADQGCAGLGGAGAACSASRRRCA